MCKSRSLTGDCGSTGAMRAREDAYICTPAPSGRMLKHGMSLGGGAAGLCADGEVPRRRSSVLDSRGWWMSVCVPRCYDYVTGCVAAWDWAWQSGVLGGRWRQRGGAVQRCSGASGSRGGSGGSGAVV